MLDETDRLPLSDGDGDGIDNLQEFAFVLDPAAPDPSSGLELASADPCVVRYRRIRGPGVGTGADYTVSGIRYVLEMSDDGGSWQALDPTAVSASDPVDNGDGSEFLAIGIESTVSLRLIRLRVELVPVE